ncbi:hypothetical protein JCM5353_008998 [Sporobolomyces roseus]
MAAPRTPQKSRLAPHDSPSNSNLRSPSPAVSRVQRPTASASPQIKAALAALRKNRRASNPPSLNSSDSTSTLSSTDAFSTPRRASKSSEYLRSPVTRTESPAGVQQEGVGVSWAKKNENRLIEAAKKTGLLNLASQGLESIPSTVYSTLLPRSSPYHPSRRNPSSYRKEPAPNYSFNRSEDETAWFEQRDLRSFNLSNNELTKLDEEVGGFEELEFLDVHCNLLDSLPPSIGWLVNLTSLNLASNSLSHFPTQIVNLRFLRDLNLSHNKLQNLWTSGWEAELAEVLKPPETSPSATPESPERVRDFFANSPFRRNIDLDTAAPASTSPFPLLQTLNLSGNTFDQTAFTSNGFEFPPRLKTLDLSSSQLVDSSLPPHLFQRLTDLTELDLSENQLTEDLFSLDIFSLPPNTALFPSLRIIDVSLNPIDNLASIEDFLTSCVSRPIEYVGLAKPILNLVKSEELRLRNGKRIGLELESEAEETIGVEIEVRVRECMLRAEQDRRRSKFPGRDGGTATPTTRSTQASLIVPPRTRSTAASPSSSPPHSPTFVSSPPAVTTPSRRQVVLEPWELEAAQGLSTPAGRRKAAAQAARETAERLKLEEEEKVRLKEERERRKKLEVEEQVAREAAEMTKKLEKVELEDTASSPTTSSRSPSPPPYSPRPSTASEPVVEDSKQSVIADPSDPALQLVLSAFDSSKRTVNFSSRSLSSLPCLITGVPPPSFPTPSTLDLSRNTFTNLPLSAIDSWTWSTTLRTLNLSHNRIAKLDPAVLASLPPLPSLLHLDLSHNLLSSTEALFSELPRLFPALRSLSLVQNRLTSLKGIDKLLLSHGSLRQLYLNANKISDISDLCSLGQQVEGKEASWRLEELDLSDNEIARLPPVLGLLPHSLIVSVSGNTFRIPRREIWENPGARLLLPNLRERLIR